MGTAALPLEALGVGPLASSSLLWPQASFTSAPLSSHVACPLASVSELPAQMQDGLILIPSLQTLFSGWDTHRARSWTHLSGDTVHPTAVTVSVGEMPLQCLLSELCLPSRGHHSLRGSSCHPDPAPHEGCVCLSSASPRAWQGFLCVQ